MLTENVMSTAQQQKPYKGWAMEGPIARWYARNTGRSLEPFKKEAQEIAQQLPSGSDVLEVAPGPGFLAIELAKLGSYRIVGLDISQSFVRIATEQEDFHQMVGQSPFTKREINCNPIGLEVSLWK
jgi:2-polyprenyl-3-methyl-5-hydroxy-6-metoxy-1,4-benzoquinol methylase